MSVTTNLFKTNYVVTLFTGENVVIDTNRVATALASIVKM